MATRKRKKKKPDLIDIVLSVLSLFATKTETTNIVKEKSKRILKHKAVASPFNSVEIINEDSDLKLFEKELAVNKSKIGLIVGSRGSGKSAVAMRIAENVASCSNRKIQAMGFNDAILPEWIDCVESIDDLNNGSFIIIDESGILFDARSSMGQMNKMLSNLLKVARHKQLSILFITQNSSNVDINIIRQLDYMIYKKAALLQKDYERSAIKKTYTEINERFTELYEEYRGLMYIYADEYIGYAENQLPSFWSDDISTNFKDA